MDHKFYLEQKFHNDGRWETRTLTAQEAKALGYKDGHKAHGEGYNLHVDGYNSLEAIQDFLDEVAAIESAYSKPKRRKTGREGER